MALLTVLLLAACACSPGAGNGGRAPGGSSPAASEAPRRLKIAASIAPLAELAKRVAGEGVDVVCLIPPGTSEHAWEPAPRDAAKARGTDVYFRVGLGFEPWVAKLLDAGGSPYETVDASEGVDLMYEAAEPGGPADSRSASTGGGAATPGKASDTASGAPPPNRGAPNPHYWLDPLAMRPALLRLSEALAAKDPAGAEGYRERAARTVQALDALDREIREKTADLPSRRFVTFHEAWNYFARRYGFQVVASIEPFPGKEPGPRHIVRLVEIVRANGIRAVFAEPQLSPKAAEVIAQECGAKVYVLDPLGGAGIPDRDDYFSLMRYNVGVMREALR
jgi:ABC-type Zn uptake system ZnuABC Zn-binding protein ZnuA